MEILRRWGRRISLYPQAGAIDRIATQDIAITAGTGHGLLVMCYAYCKPVLSMLKHGKSDQISALWIQDPPPPPHPPPFSLSLSASPFFFVVVVVLLLLLLFLFLLSFLIFPRGNFESEG